MFDITGKFQKAVHLDDCVYGHGLKNLGNNEFSVTDMDGHKIYVLDSEFQEKMRFDCHNRPKFQGAFNHPTDCDRSKDGRFYISDGYGNSVVHIFSNQGKHITTFGEPGRASGQFSTPHSIVIDQQQRVCVADRENNRIQRFTLDGKFIDEIIDVYKPMALATLPNGTLLCTDQTPKLSAFSLDGSLIGRCRTFGTFAHGIDIAPNGTIVIAEMMPNRLSFLLPLES